jgi:hypothetical protein
MSKLRRSALLAILTAAAVAGWGAAAVAHASTAGRTPSAYASLLLTTLDRCQAPVNPQPRTTAEVVRCVGGLAAPSPQSAQELDIFNIFEDCLYFASHNLDNMYPPPWTNPALVNKCLEDVGVL